MNIHECFDYMIDSVHLKLSDYGWDELKRTIPDLNPDYKHHFYDIQSINCDETIDIMSVESRTFFNGMTVKCLKY